MRFFFLFLLEVQMIFSELRNVQIQNYYISKLLPSTF